MYVKLCIRSEPTVHCIQYIIVCVRVWLVRGCVCACVVCACVCACVFGACMCGPQTVGVIVACWHVVMYSYFHSSDNRDSALLDTVYQFQTKISWSSILKFRNILFLFWVQI